MADVESDEHLRIFKCLIDTGSLVLRNAIGIKLLNNNSISFVQYLENNKHQFYHQFEKNIRSKCCLGNPHGCVYNGIMDKKIFYKMYTKTAEQNTRDCLDRFEIKADISLDMLDLSDLNFFLWNSRTLSAQEENSLKKIMSIRSSICHPPSSQSYSIVELERYWSDLESAVLMFAEPKSYKDIVELQIETLQSCKLNALQSEKIIQQIRTESDKIIHAIQQDAQASNTDIENFVKNGNIGLQNCFMNANDKTQSYINDKLTELKERSEIHYNKTITCKEEIETKMTEECMKTRKQSEDQQKCLDTKLTESENKVCQTVAQSQTHITVKMEEEARETRRQTDELLKSLERQQTDILTENRKLTVGLKTLIGMIGKQKINIGLNPDQIEELAETEDAQEIHITSELHQSCLTEDKERKVIENLPSEIHIPPSKDNKSDASEKQTLQVVVKKVNSIMLKLKAPPGIFESVETLRSAILTLVENVHIAGGIDGVIEDTVTVNLRFESPLTKDQIAVVKCLFTNEWNTDNYEKAFDEYPSSALRDEANRNMTSKRVDTHMECYPEIDTNSQRGTSEAAFSKLLEVFTRTPCQSCKHKDEMIKALEEKNKEHRKTIEKYELSYMRARIQQRHEISTSEPDFLSQIQSCKLNPVSYKTAVSKEPPQPIERCVNQSKVSAQELPFLSVAPKLKYKPIPTPQQLGLTTAKKRQLTSTDEYRESEMEESHLSIKAQFEKKRIENIRTRNQFTVASGKRRSKSAPTISLEKHEKEQGIAPDESFMKHLFAMLGKPQQRKPNIHRRSYKNVIGYEDDDNLYEILS